VRLSAFPVGLLDLIGSQSFGENVKDLSPTIVPTIDVTDLYLANRFETIVQNVTTDVLANGQNAAKTFVITVPIGEIWRVQNVSAFLGTGVGEALTAYLWLTIPGINGSVVTAISESTTLPASTNGWRAMSVPPFYAKAGCKFGIWGSLVTGVPTASITANVARFRA
jgi:hypothetical protein